MNTTNEQKEYILQKDIPKLLKVSERTVRRYIESGELYYYNEVKKQVDYGSVKRFADKKGTPLADTNKEKNGQADTSGHEQNIPELEREVLILRERDKAREQEVRMLNETIADLKADKHELQEDKRVLNRLLKAGDNAETTRQNKQADTSGQQRTSTRQTSGQERTEKKQNNKQTRTQSKRHDVRTSGQERTQQQKKKWYQFFK